MKNLFPKLLHTLGSSIANNPTAVKENEEISCFIVHEKDRVKSTNTIRYNRLMPRRNSKNNRLEVSICRSSSLSEAALWNICSRYFDSSQQHPAIGRGISETKFVFSENLYFDADGIPYPEHANIIGWQDSPSTPDDELKNNWMYQAQAMAAHFHFYERPKVK